MTHPLSFVRMNPFRIAAALAMAWAAALAALPAAGEGTTADLFVPIVLSSGGAAGSFYTTELTLANRGTTPATIEVKCTAAFGGGSGRFREPLEPGEQRVIPDAIAFLVARGLPLPATGDRGGTLRLTFYGLSSPDAAAVTARTTTATSSPQPLGAAGLAYPGSTPQSGLKASATLYGIRANAQDRSNVAIYNPTIGDVTVRVVAFAGDGSGASVVKADALKVPAYGWTQFSGILDGTGFVNGWVTVEKTADYGAFGAYGVVNCNGTSDGSYLTPTTPDATGDRVTVPVLVETTSGFLSELVLSNRGSTEATLTLGYTESLSPVLGTGGRIVLKLGPREQLVIPDALAYLRGKGLEIGAKGAASYAGALRVSVEGAALSDVFAGARTASLSPAAGQFGLFTLGVYEGQEASTEAWLYGLRADATNRTNVAVLNAGADGTGAVTLELQAYDGDAAGLPRGDPEQVTLDPGAWAQKSGFLGSKGVANGWVRVKRLVGSAPWISYAVVNDGAGPGERTGDGAYVPMVVTPPPSPWEVSIFSDSTAPRTVSYPSVTYDPSGTPTISYTASLPESLTSETRVARWDRVTSSWQISSLPGTDPWHTPSLATDPGDGKPSVVFGSDVLQLAHWTGSSWKVEAVETVGKINDHPSLAYGPDGYPSISYLAKTPTTGLRFARWNGSGWVTQSVDSDPSVDRYCTFSSLAFDSQGNPAIAYGARKGTGSDADTLKLARWTGSSWRIEIVEGGVLHYGDRPSLAFDGQSTPFIAHGRGAEGPPGIRLVRWDGQGWTGELVNADGVLGRLVFDRSGTPLVGFVSWVDASAWMARRETGGRWTAELVEGSLGSAASPMLELDPEGKPSLVYSRQVTGADGITAYSIGFARRTGE